MTLAQINGILWDNINITPPHWQQRNNQRIRGREGGGAIPAGYWLIEFSPSGSQKWSTEENGLKEAPEDGSEGRWRDEGREMLRG